MRVCAFPASRLGLQGIGISPDCNPENRATPRQVLEHLTVNRLVLLVIDQYQVFSHLIWPHLQLFSWALEPAEDDILDKLFEQGYTDAAMWAQENPVGELVRDDSSSIGSSLAQ